MRMRATTGKGTAIGTAALLFGVLSIDTALAAPPAISAPGLDFFDNGPTGVAPTGPFSFLSGVGHSSYLLGDMWGLRTALAGYGITFAMLETSEVLGNATGGNRRGVAYDGLTQMLLQMHTNRAFGWHGGTLNISALQIHGTNLSSNNLLTLHTASGIEADRATRLWEAWYQQKFLDEDRLDVRIGQMSLDQEFMVSQNASYFVNTMFGWPMVPSADLPGGGPAYPLSALGVRLRARPVDSLTFLFGVYNGSPSPSNVGDPQMANPSGTSLPLNGGVLMIAEMQYAYPSLGTMLYADQSEPLGRIYKLGMYFDTENFADQQFDNQGLSLANPVSNGMPLNHHGDFGIYAVADQLVWVDKSEGDRTISLFGRVLAAPQPDRNLITFSVNAGLTMHEPFLHRDDDTFGIGVGFAKVSGSVSSLDKATAFYTGGYIPRRSSETFVEITYQYQLTPWCQLQPDLQYVFTPGGGVADPAMPEQRVGNELVLGLCTNILFLSVPMRLTPLGFFIMRVIRILEKPGGASHGFVVHFAKRTNMSSATWLFRRRMKAFLVAASLTVAVPAWADQPRGFLETVKKHATLTSTVSDNGDQNPYAVVVAPVSAGKIQKDDVLVDNFNDLSNLQGPGTTIVDYSPMTKKTTMIAALPRHLPQCPGGIGLTTAMTMLRTGWIIVGSTPSSDGTTRTRGDGCLLVLDPNGRLVATWAGPEINGPWGNMAVLDEGETATLFVSMAGFDVPAPTVRDPESGYPITLRKATVLRIVLAIPPGKPPVVKSKTVIASGFRHRADRDAFLIGPTGLALGPDGTLYVPDAVDNRIVAIPSALTRTTSAGTGQEVTKGGLLNQPLALIMLPNGHLLSCNGRNGQVVEIDPAAGKQLYAQWIDANQAQSPPGNGDLFGIAMRPDGKAFYVQGEMNSLVETR